MATLTVEVDERAAREFKDFCEEVGLSMSSAVNLFVTRVTSDWRIPFEIRGNIPDAGALDALRESEEIMRNPSAYPHYKSTAELNAALDAMEEAEDDDEQKI